MAKMGWHVAAALLNKWFAHSPKNQAENAFQKARGHTREGVGYPLDCIDTRTISLDWVLSYRARRMVISNYKMPDISRQARRRTISFLYIFTADRTFSMHGTAGKHMYAILFVTAWRETMTARAAVLTAAP